MGALLASIGIRDYVYAGLIAALIGGFTYYTHHERSIGAEEALAPVAVLAQKAQVQVAVGAAIAQSTEKENAQTYTAVIAAPRVPDLGVVCHYDTRSGDVPQAVGGGSAAAGQPAADSGVGPAFDPSGAILERAREADAQIAYLQARVRELESQMESSP